MNILTVNDLSDKFLIHLFWNIRSITRDLTEYGLGTEETDWIKDPVRNKIMTTVFLEPSTRTRVAFESSMQRLGGKVISITGEDASLQAKREDISDTIATVSLYSDVVIVRSSEPISEWKSNKQGFSCPVINAGDGPWNHPIQAITDAYTIWQHQQQPQSAVPSSTTIGIVGDIRKSRTIRSFIQLMNRGKNNKFVIYDSTRGIKEFVEDELPDGVSANVCSTLRDFKLLVPEFDIFYLNRSQDDRWKRKIYETFEMSDEIYSTIRPDCIVLNPGPRRLELPSKYDLFPNNKMWDQAKNGMFVKMALLRKIL